MTAFRIAFSNICQGLWYQGDKDGVGVYSRYWPTAFKDQYLQLNPDILCFAEAPLENEEGESLFVTGTAHAMGAVAHFVDVHDKSWILEDKFYGLSMFSKYDLSDYEAPKLVAPHLEVDRPDGMHWTLHSKSIQAATITIGGKKVRVFNLHYFPVHYFKRSLRDPELQTTRKELVDYIRSGGLPTIVTGDFNNDDDELRTAFPELFENGFLEEAIVFDTSQFDGKYNGRQQLDHVLYTPDSLTLKNAEIIRDRADHRGIVADFEI